MKHFMDYVNEYERNRKTFTENGAVAYESSGHELLDFNFRLTDLRSSSENEIISSFKSVFYNNDIVTAIKYLFYVGDIREGLGERNIFRTCLAWLASSHPIETRKILYLIPEYSRWDVLIKLVTIPQVKNDVIQLVRNQFIDDISSLCVNKPISLLAKWMPSENASSLESRQLAKIFIRNLGMTPRMYRKNLSALRRHLDVVEVKMSANKWDEIDYSAVPSKANLNYNEAFYKHDAERRTEYLTSLVKGETKINASVTQPHEIVNKYNADNYWYRPRIGRYDETLEQIWKALPSKNAGNTLVVRDGSGSMTSKVSGKITALDVATALAIYCSEHTKGSFRDKFITFSSRPKLVDLSRCSSLHDKIDLAYNEAEISDTNIYKTMRLVLDTAVANNLEQSELPDTILIISDMQFNGGSFNFNNSLFDSISNEFNYHGYKLPRICFWNVCGYNAKTIPMQSNEYGLILCSGFSPNNIKMFMSGEIDPLKILLDTINAKRYTPIERALID